MQRTTRTERRAACLPRTHFAVRLVRKPMPQPTAAYHGATESTGGAVQLPRAVLPALVPVRRVRRRADQRQAHRRRRRARPRRLRVRTAARVARGTRATGSRTAHGCAHTIMRAILAVRGSGAIGRNALCSIRVRVKMRSSEILLLAITAVRRQRVGRVGSAAHRRALVRSAPACHSPQVRRLRPTARRRRARRA